MPDITSTMAVDTASIAALIIALIACVKPFIKSGLSGASDADKIRAVAALAGTILVPAFEAAAPGFAPSYAAFLTAAAQGFSLGYGVTMAYAGGQNVLANVSVSKAAPAPAPAAPATPAPSA